MVGVIRTPQRHTSAPRKMDTQLTKLNDEIDAVTKKIDEEKEEWKTATPEKAAVYLKSIDVLNEALKGLRASRDRIIDAATAAPAPGKNAPSRPRCQCPPSTREHAKPRSLSRPLVRRHDSNLVSNHVSNHVPNSRLRVRTGRVRPSCEECCVLCLFGVCVVRYAVDAPLVVRLYD